MGAITKLYYVMFAILLIAIAVMSKAHAVEVSPRIGFKQAQAQNGSEYNPSAAYRSPLQQQKNASLNSKLFSDNQITKAIPDINSVGLDFTFKVD